ncbi:MAG: flippase-like domain-containing protein [Acidobacteria bacterium]|nr:flippase-like domain-containing protein [Acidobacteriota bacterium]
MDRKRLLITSVVVVVLVVLVILQAHAYRKFDWSAFGHEIAQVNWWMVLAAIGVVHLADALRAVRWSIFLRPVRSISPLKLLAAQYIGFAGLALLGRPGEFIRPYIIAKRARMTFASQVAVWTVERICDMSAVAIILACDLLFADTLRTFPQYDTIRAGGVTLITLVGFGALIAFIVWKYGGQIAARLEANHQPSHIRHRLAFRIRSFGEGLHTIHDVPSFFAVAGLSLSIWMLIASSYWLVLHSYTDPELTTLSLVHSILLMAGSVAGGVLQLPLVGGGSQLATINLLLYLFNVNPDEPELATSCGILLWLVTFMSVLPLGLILARMEHVSLRKITSESVHQEEAL